VNLRSSAAVIVAVCRRSGDVTETMTAEMALMRTPCGAHSNNPVITADLMRCGEYTKAVKHRDIIPS